MNIIVNGETQIRIDSSAFPPFQTAVTIIGNNITAIATDPSTTPPTTFTCTGSLSFNGDISANLECLEGGL